MTKFLSTNGNNASLISTAASPIMGMDDCVISNIPEYQKKFDEYAEKGYEQSNFQTHQKFLPEMCAAPHARFLGLA